MQSSIHCPALNYEHTLKAITLRYSVGYKRKTS
jgi:hypothetical protein